MKISRKTKSTAYKFIKSLMKDGASGEDVHKLVSAISDNISEKIGGQILMDLLTNPSDKNADLKHHTHWFGPFTTSWYNCITTAWAAYCDDTDLRGTFRFGDIDIWKEWRRNGNSKMTNEELKIAAAKCNDCICVFGWWADDATSQDVKKFLSELYLNVQESMTKKKEEGK